MLLLNSSSPNEHQISNENKVEGDTFNNVPVGIDVRFLAVAYQKEKIFATLTSIKKVKENHQEKLTLNEVTEKEFDQLMKKVK